MSARIVLVLLVLLGVGFFVYRLVDMLYDRIGNVL